MRNYMTMLEGIMSEDTPVGVPDDIAQHTSGMGASLKGTFLNPDMMLQYFPSVQDKHAFNRAWRKIVRNQEERLQRNEMFEISRAFCDILRMAPEDKLSFIRRIMNVNVADGEKEETANTIYR